jgi:hypothetical protein
VLWGEETGIDLECEGLRAIFCSSSINFEWENLSGVICKINDCGRIKTVNVHINHFVRRHRNALQVILADDSIQRGQINISDILDLYVGALDIPWAQTERATFEYLGLRDSRRMVIKSDLWSFAANNSGIASRMSVERSWTNKCAPI